MRVKLVKYLWLKLKCYTLYLFHFCSSWKVTSLVMLLLSSVITLSLLFMIKTPHELGRQNKYGEIKVILEKIREKSGSEILKEIEMLKIQIGTESDTEPFLQKIKKLNKKKVFVLLVVYVFFSNLAGINIISTYLLEIFSDLQVSGSILVIFYGGSEMVFSFLQMLIADKFGR